MRQDKEYLSDLELTIFSTRNNINITIIREDNDTLEYQLIIKNNIDTIQDILLEIPLQQIDKIIITQLQNHKKIKFYQFNSKNFSQRIYYDRNAIFPFTLLPYQTSIILFKIHKNELHNFFGPDVLVWKKDAKITRTEALEMTRGVFYGILILYTFICLLLTIMLKVRNYFYYLLYFISGVVYLFIKNNLGYELLWPD